MVNTRLHINVSKGRASWPRYLLAGILLALNLSVQAAVDPWKLLLNGDTPEKLQAITSLSENQGLAALPALQALLNGSLYATPAGRVVIINDADEQVYDAASGALITPAPEDLEKISINNRIRGQLHSTLAGLRLASTDRETRKQAVMVLQTDANEDMLARIRLALDKEKDQEIADLLRLTLATLTLASPDVVERRAAVDVLVLHPSVNVKSLLAARLQKDTQGQMLEPDAALQVAIRKAISRVDTQLSLYEYLGRAFSGLSLGSILLLAALGLAITFGLMGIINMAHGELLMIGAYATYLVQVAFQTFLPTLFDWYLLAAIPAAFLISALVGIAMERSVIRFLYGRPLETLLATWGISLVLMQSVRSLFGAQNVEVANPAWMSGGLHLASGLVLPYNRIAIIFFAVAVVFLMWLLLNRTRLGLYVRAVTQNRGMADCLGVSTPRVDMLAFGLGAGIAGLGGCALSQIGNVGPDLGQSYIVDSFMVVVLGGVGQLAGTVIAALGLGEVNKFLEPYAGAVLAKIFILVFIIIFIQKRPQGLFALRGRSLES